MEIQFHGTYQKETILKALKIAGKPTKKSAIFRIGIAIFLVGFVFFALISTFSNPQPPLDLARMILNSLLLLIAVYFLFTPYISPYQTTAKLWKNPRMHQPVSGIITNEKIIFNNFYKSGDFCWGNIFKKFITEDLIVLVENGGRIIYLPRYFFADEKDWQMFFAWVKTRVHEAI